MKYDIERVHKLMTENGLISLMGQPERYGYVKNMGNVLMANQFGVYFDGIKQYDNAGDLIVTDRSNHGDIVGEFNSYTDLKTQLSTEYPDGTGNNTFNNITLVNRFTQVEDIYTGLSETISEILGEIRLEGNSDDTNEIFRVQTNRHGTGSTRVLTLNCNFDIGDFSISDAKLSGDAEKRALVMNSIESNDFILVMTISAHGTKELEFRIALYNDFDNPIRNPETQMILGLEYRLIRPSGTPSRSPMDWLLHIKSMTSYREGNSTDLKLYLIKEDDIDVPNKIVKSNSSFYCLSTTGTLYTSYWELLTDANDPSAYGVADQEMVYDGLINLSNYTASALTFSKFYKTSSSSNMLGTTSFWRDNNVATSGGMYDTIKVFIKRPVFDELNECWYLPLAKRIYVKSSYTYGDIRIIKADKDNVITYLGSYQNSWLYFYASGANGSATHISNIYGADSGMTYIGQQSTNENPVVVIPKSNSKQINIYRFNSNSAFYASVSNYNIPSCSTTSCQTGASYAKLPLLCTSSYANVSGMILVFGNEVNPNTDHIEICKFKQGTYDQFNTLNSHTPGALPASFPYVESEFGTGSGNSSPIEDLTDAISEHIGYMGPTDPTNLRNKQMGFTGYISRCSTHTKNSQEIYSKIYLSVLDKETGTINHVIVNVSNLDDMSLDSVVDSPFAFKVDNEIPSTSGDSSSSNIPLEYKLVFDETTMTDHYTQLPTPTILNDTVSDSVDIELSVDVSGNNDVLVGLNLELNDLKKNKKI